MKRQPSLFDAIDVGPPLYTLRRGADLRTETVFDGRTRRLIVFTSHNLAGAYAQAQDWRYATVIETDQARSSDYNDWRLDGRDVSGEARFKALQETTRA